MTNETTFWTADKIAEGYQRANGATSVTLPIEQFTELLNIASAQSDGMVLPLELIPIPYSIESLQDYDRGDESARWLCWLLRDDAKSGDAATIGYGENPRQAVLAAISQISKEPS